MKKIRNCLVHATIRMAMVIIIKVCVFIDFIYSCYYTFLMLYVSLVGHRCTVLSAYMLTCVIVQNYGGTQRPPPQKLTPLFPQKLTQFFPHKLTPLFPHNCARLFPREFTGKEWSEFVGKEWSELLGKEWSEFVGKKWSQFLVRWPLCTTVQNRTQLMDGRDAVYRS